MIPADDVRLRLEGVEWPSAVAKELRVPRSSVYRLAPGRTRQPNQSPAPPPTAASISSDGHCLASWSSPCLAVPMTLRAARRPAMVALVAAAWLPQPAPAATDQPPPYIPDTCGPRPWIIGFETGSTTLTPFASRRLDALVSAWHAEPGPLVASGRVDGQEDHPGETLSAERLKVVLKALEERGLPTTAIWPRDDAGRAGLVPNGPGISEPQNRTVWIEAPSQGHQCLQTKADKLKAWIKQHCLPAASEDLAACGETLDRLTEGE